MDDLVWIHNPKTGGEAPVPAATLNHWRNLADSPWEEGRKPATEKADAKATAEAERVTRELADAAVANERRMTEMSVADGALIDAFGEPLDPNRFAAKAKGSTKGHTTTTPEVGAS